MSTTNLQTLMHRFWESACIDNPVRPSCIVKDGQFVLTVTGKPEMWSELSAAAGVPDNAEQDETLLDNSRQARWISHADAIFGDNGQMSQVIDNYQPRLPQLHMARMVQRAFEMKTNAAIEAGTGTGKSLAYLAPALAMNKRIIVSTSNKALQMQLYKKDAPMLIESLFPGKKVVLAQGKRNYLCLNKLVNNESGEDASTTLAATPELAQWCDTTETGNVEEIPFEVDNKSLQAITVDDNCNGKQCGFYHDCFYFKAKAERQGADVLICNHALLVLHFMYPQANILPGNIDVIVIDEAHKFIDYVRNANSVEIKPGRFAKLVELLQDTPFHDEAKKHQRLLNQYIFDQVQDNRQEQIIPAQEIINAGLDLAGACLNGAEIVWSSSNFPKTPEERREFNKAKKLRRFAGDLMFACHQAQEGYTRWVSNRDELVMEAAPWNVARIVRAWLYTQATDDQIARNVCQRCEEHLGEEVAILEERPYCMECIQFIDVAGDAEFVTDWQPEQADPPPLFRHAPPIIFTSATLAAPDMKAFMRDLGIQDALQMVAASPFDYKAKSILYVPNGDSPLPSDKKFGAFAVSEIDRLVRLSGGGAFCLFTSNSNMRYVSQELKHKFQALGLEVYVQGELPKLEIAKRFREDGNAVLFATKTFWEGVDIQGDALRLVIIDKLPFPAPHPLLAAQKEAVGNNAFYEVDIPLAIIDLKQGTGRLIRTVSDSGVVAILDSRLRTSQYGRRQVLPSLPPMPLVHSHYQIASFFDDMAAKPQVSELTPLQQFGLEAGHEFEDALATL